MKQVLMPNVQHHKVHYSAAGAYYAEFDVAVALYPC
jgi:hypothetical protein